MSITGAPTAPATAWASRSRHRQRHVCGAGCCIRLVRAGADGQGATRRYWNARSHGCVADLPGGHLLRDRIDTGAHGESASHDRAYETFGPRSSSLRSATTRQWKRFCGVMGATDLEADERFATNRGRVSHYTTLRPILTERLRSRNRADWVSALRAAGVPCGSVRDIGEVLSDPISTRGA